MTCKNVKLKWKLNGKPQRQKLFKNSERENNFEVEKLGAKILWIGITMNQFLIGIKNIPTRLTLIQITPTKINPFQKIWEISDQSMIKTTFMQYKRYSHHWGFLQYTRHQYLLMGVQASLHHHHMNHRQKSWYLKEILNHSTIHPIRYRTYHLTLIQTQVSQILLRQIHLTHQTMSIINEHDVWKRTKRNAGVKSVLMTQ